MPRSADRARCDRPDCRGVAIRDGRCLAHLGPKTEETVAAITREGKPLDLSGCGTQALYKVFDALPMDGEVPICKGLIAAELQGGRDFRLRKSGVESPVRVEGDIEISASALRQVLLHDATVSGKCHFSNVKCEYLSAMGTICGGELSAQNLEVSGDLNLSYSQLGGLSLREAEVAGTTNVSGAVLGTAVVAGHFRGLTTFEGAHVDQALDLRGSVLSDLTLVGATVEGSVSLSGGRLSSLDLRGAKVGGRLLLPNLSIDGQADFGGARIGGIGCARTRFLGQTDFGGTVISGSHSDFSGVTAQLRVDATVTSDTVDLSGAHFRDGLDLRLGESAVRLDATRFDAPSLVSGAPPEKAEVVSIAGARLRNLALAHVDLSNCLMEGAAELDQLKLGDGVVFPRAPLAIVGRLGARGRQVIANDIEWRQRTHPHSAWTALPSPVDTHPEALRKSRPALPSTPEIEELYRSLRIARELGGNSPGAASFYYGEMEMRRLRRWSGGWDEKVIVWIYWALAGYGLRASRALVALVVFWALGAFFFLHLGGFLNDAPLSDTLVFTASSGLSFVHAPPDDLTVTTGGEAAQLVLRIGTAALLALATLALRGRVKR